MKVALLSHIGQSRRYSHTQLCDKWSGSELFLPFVRSFSHFNWLRLLCRPMHCTWNLSSCKMYISLQRTGKSHSFNTTGETVNSWFTKDTRASSRADDFYSISKDAYRIIQLLDLTDELDEKQWLAEMYLYLNDNEMEKSSEKWPSRILLAVVSML